MRSALPFPELDLEACMREALTEAETAGRAGEYPFGAVVVVGGEIVSRGRSRQIAQRSQLAHAELEALLAGGEPLWKRHDEAVLFATVEPCPMCLGATVMADVPHVVFALPDALIDSSKIVEIPYVARHIATYRGGVLAEESRAIFERYRPELLEYLVTGILRGEQRRHRS